MVRIVVADDHMILIQGIRKLLLCFGIAIMVFGAVVGWASLFG
jgi:hypothetical protein